MNIEIRISPEIFNEITSCPLKESDTDFMQEKSQFLIIKPERRG
jgi:hypothetical protein